jgi:2-isopropylmalate synthase
MISTSPPALGITLDENLENIAASIAHLVAQGREALFDAEHFFDGYKANPAMRCLPARGAGGGRALGRAVRHQWRHAAA